MIPAGVPDSCEEESTRTGTRFTATLLQEKKAVHGSR